MDFHAPERRQVPPWPQDDGGRRHLQLQPDRLPGDQVPSALFVRIIKGAKDVEDGKAQSIAGLKKIDDYTLQITLENPVDLPYFLF